MYRTGTYTYTYLCTSIFKHIPTYGSLNTTAFKSYAVSLIFLSLKIIPTIIRRIFAIFFLPSLRSGYGMGRSDPCRVQIIEGVSTAAKVCAGAGCYFFYFMCNIIILDFGYFFKILYTIIRKHPFLTTWLMKKCTTKMLELHIF